MIDRTDPRSIAAAADIFIQRYGKRAVLEAALRERELAEAGKVAGMTRWRLIRKAIETRAAPRLTLVSARSDARSA